MFERQNLTGTQAEIMAEVSKHLIAAWQNNDYPVSESVLAHMSGSVLAGVRIGLLVSGKPVDVANTIVDPLAPLLLPLVERISREAK